MRARHSASARLCCIRSRRSTMAAPRYVARAPNACALRSRRRQRCSGSFSYVLLATANRHNAPSSPSPHTSHKCSARRQRRQVSPQVGLSLESLTWGAFFAWSVSQLGLCFVAARADSSYGAPTRSSLSLSLLLSLSLSLLDSTTRSHKSASARGARGGGSRVRCERR